MNDYRRYLALTPLFSVLIFLALYATAALEYPGGTKLDPSSPGFSVLGNYWCDLLDVKAYNGQPNVARPLALAGLFVLAVGLGFFWTLAPGMYPRRRRAALLTRVAGMISLALLLLLPTAHHNMGIYGSGVFGILAAGTVLLALAREKQHFLAGVALSTVFLALVNLYSWHTGHWLVALPLLQKLAFLLFFLWVCLVSGRLFVTRRKRV